MKTYRLSKLLGIALGSLHFLIIGFTLLLTGGVGESQGYIILFFDFPLVWLLTLIPAGGFILDGSRLAYLTFFPIVGTLMYALAGMMLGYAIDKATVWSL